MLVTAGAQNAFAHYSERYPQINLSEVISLQPDLILLPTEPYSFTETDIVELRKIPEFKDLPIQIIDGTFHWHSTKIGERLANLSKDILG